MAYDIELMRHSLAHVMAAAVKKLHPDVKFAGGPAIENGFYYDFDYENGFTYDVLSKIEAEKKKIDTRAEDAKPNEFYYHSYCPSNPKSYEILFDIIDEVIEVFKPEEYVHMGHDEVYQLGVCPVCNHPQSYFEVRNENY